MIGLADSLYRIDIQFRDAQTTGRGRERFRRAEKGRFYHGGRCKDYDAVINHYKPVLKFELTANEQSDVVPFHKSL